MQEGAWTDFSKRKKRKEKKSRLKPPLLSSGNGDKYKDHATKGKQPGTLIKKKRVHVKRLRRLKGQTGGTEPTFCLQD